MKIQAHVYMGSKSDTHLIWQHKKYLMLQHEKK
jgi:hypothetical protein